jgi:hypothetical protein
MEEPTQKREDHAMEWKNLLQELNNPLPYDTGIMV